MMARTLYRCRYNPAIFLKVSVLALCVVLPQHDAAWEAEKLQCKIQVECHWICTRHWRQFDVSEKIIQGSRKLANVLQPVKVTEKAGHKKKALMSKLDDHLRMRIFRWMFAMHVYPTCHP